MFRFFRLLAALSALALLAADAPTGPAYRVKDINTTTATDSVYMIGSVESAGVLFFALANLNGLELWKTDGTEEGTVVLLSDGLYGSFDGGLVVHGGKVFFGFREASTGRELWTSDGTPAGTRIVKDIYPGQGGSVSSLISFGTELFFQADDGVHGSELWKTADGSPESTVLAADLAPGPSSSSPHDPRVVGNQLYFFIIENPGQFVLVRSDGTASGVVRLRSFTGHVPEVCAGFCFTIGPRALGVLNGKLIFAGTDPSTGIEPWRTDGSSDGASLLRDIFIGSRHSSPSYPTLFGGSLYFNAYDDVHGSELWRTDGTPEGTALIREIQIGPYGGSPIDITVAGDSLYFSAIDAHGVELWRSDGTEAGTTLVKDIAPGVASSSPRGLTAAGNLVFFRAGDPGHGVELWRSDGTEAGTIRVSDIAPGPASSDPYNLVEYRDAVLFIASDGSQVAGLWRSDGTSTGTVLVRRMESPSSKPGLLGALGENVILGAREGDALAPGVWRSDGTEQGTLRLTDDARLDALEIDGLNRFGVELPGRFLFRGTTQEQGAELWATDGTADGTRLVKDIVAGSGGSHPHPFARLGSVALFGAPQLASGHELWRSDGTEAGTVMVKDIRAGPGGSNPWYDLVAFGGAAYFAADDGVHGWELWRSDGTEAGTRMVREIQPGPVGNPPFGFAATRDFLFFIHCGGDGLCGLWRTDGTEAGTLPVLGGPSEANDLPLHLTGVGNLVFFIDATPPRQLWRSDGTEPGTFPVRNLATDIYGEYPQHGLTASGGRLYFRDWDPEHGFELWSSDGTGEGTRLVADIRPGPLGSSPRALADVGGILLFAADDGESGSELWRSDGSVRGTRRVQDIDPGPASSNPFGFLRAGSRVFFSATDGDRGRELWAVPMTALTATGTSRPDARVVPFRP